MPIASTAGLPRTGPLFHFAPSPGPYPVGLKVVEQYDYSRVFRHDTDGLGKSYSGERARPLQTLVWYPASRGTGEPMTVGGYLDLWASETSFDNRRLPLRAQKWQRGMHPTLGLSLRAVRDSPAASRRFPLVIYAPSFSSPSWENADLCEYLASHGYVVVASPSMGLATRDMTRDLEGIEAQARDISFLLGYGHTLPNADMSAVSVAGFSWGGISNLFAAARDDRIRALVALDGSLRASPGLVARAGDIHPRRMAIPLLSISQGLWTPEDQALLVDTYPGEGGPNVLNAWTHGDLVSVHLLGMSHVEFSAMFQRNEDIWWGLLEAYQGKRADYGREDGVSGYAWMACYTLQFLDAYLKHSAEALAFLRRPPVENGVPRHLMAVMNRPAVEPPATIGRFRTELGLNGFERAADVHEKLRRQDATFDLGEEVICGWADELAQDEQLTEAMALYRLNVLLHPTSGHGHASLGLAYETSGQKELAVDSYRAALGHDPGNADARRGLDELRGRMPGGE